jgi:hypothetical protein
VSEEENRAQAGHDRGELRRMKMTPNPIYEDMPHVEPGDRIGVKMKDGKIIVGTVASYEEDEETGEIKITLERFPSAPPGWNALGHK